MNKKTIFVGMSGGVDSSVSAALLLKQSYEVVGVFIRTWHPDFLECNEEEERLDAMRVCAHLNIPFLTLDLEDVYKKEVADYMISEYKKGRTPNPDVMCNKEVKFGAFLKKALSMGADYVATGHYASLRRDSKKSSLNPQAGEPRSSFLLSLLRGNDPSKDQSYFLWTLRQEQLSKILFPVGDLEKSEVRKLAKKFKLPVADKKDSQGICFLGAVDLKEFLKHYIKEKKGKVQNDKGEIIGHHSGVVFHTLGERHGFVITKKSPNDKPYYVVGKDLKKNILIVSQNKDQKHSGILKNIRIEKTNWISGAPKSDKKPARNAAHNAAGGYSAQIRYHGEFLPCEIKVLPQNKAEVIFKAPVMVASGQSVVVYDGAICLGGGVVV